MAGDQNYAERLARDDQEVLSEILRSYGSKIEKVIRTKIPSLNGQDCEDALSIGVRKLWRSRRNYDPGKGSVPAWFYRIVMNSARDIDRKKRRQERTVGDLHLLVTPVEPQYPRTELNGILSELLQTMSDKDRRIVIEGAKHNDGKGHNIPWAVALAAELDMSPGAIRTKRVRLVSWLKDEMLKIANERGIKVP